LQQYRPGAAIRVTAIRVGSNENQMAIGLPTNLWRAEMRRREFIAGFTGTAILPTSGHAQQRGMPIVGFLTVAAADGYRPYAAGFRQGLGQEGFIEGQNVRVEYRWGNNQTERLPDLAADLVRQSPAVLLVGSGTAAGFVANSLKSTVPIVFALGIDPVKTGMVASLNRPGGNMTGVTYITAELTGKRLGLLRALAPQAAAFGYLTSDPQLSLSVNSRNTAVAEEEAEAVAFAPTLGWDAAIEEIRSADDFDTAFARFAERRVGALFVAPSPLTTTNRGQLIVLSARHKIPTMYGLREFPQEGGLLSYGASIADAYRLAGRYVGRILKGEKPADLPVERSTKLEFVINLKTAKSLDVAIPPTLLALADEVIE
jgi:putative tryptophan/tyrosine transport system substrate-binding protein